jgi:phage portal protein BeeE
MVDLKIARAFGVPPEALSMSIDSNSMTYQNVAQSNIRTLQQTLNRYMDEIEEQLSDLLPGNKNVRFREEDLMRLDLLGKWQMIEAQVRVGYTSGDELRQAEGKQPLPKPAVEPDKQPFQKKADDEN